MVVTDGTDSFYNSRTVFQSLFDYGDFDKITALGSSIAESKKMLISRQVCLACARRPFCSHEEHAPDWSTASRRFAGSLLWPHRRA